MCCPQHANTETLFKCGLLGNTKHTAIFVISNLLRSHYQADVVTFYILCDLILLVLFLIKCTLKMIYIHTCTFVFVRPFAIVMYSQSPHHQLWLYTPKTRVLTLNQCPQSPKTVYNGFGPHYVAGARTHTLTGAAGDRSPVTHYLPIRICTFTLLHWYAAALTPAAAFPKLLRGAKKRCACTPPPFTTTWTHKSQILSQSAFMFGCASGYVCPLTFLQCKYAAHINGSDTLFAYLQGFLHTAWCNKEHRSEHSTMIINSLLEVLHIFLFWYLW